MLIQNLKEIPIKIVQIEWFNKFKLFTQEGLRLKIIIKILELRN